MKRRTILALVAGMPLYGVRSASACSPATTTPLRSSLIVDQIRQLFTSWMLKDRESFKSKFTDLVDSDGTLMNASDIQTELTSEPVAEDNFEIFDAFFQKEAATHSINLIVESVAGIFVSCSETFDVQGELIGGECPVFPMQHQFFVTMRGLNPKNIEHLGSKPTAYADKFSVWMAPQVM